MKPQRGGEVWPTSSTCVPREQLVHYVSQSYMFVRILMLENDEVDIIQAHMGRGRHGGTRCLVGASGLPLVIDEGNSPLCSSPPSQHHY